MLLAGQCVAHLDDLEEFGDVVGRLSDCGRQFLPLASEVAAEVTTLGCKRACFVGAGVLRGVADECALKLVELSAGNVTTLAETSLGLRHAFLILAAPRHRAVYICPNEALQFRKPKIKWSKGSRGDFARQENCTCL